MQCFMQNSWSVIPMNQTLKIARGLGEGREGLESSGVIQNNPLPPHKKIISSIFIEIDFLLDSNHQMDFT